MPIKELPISSRPREKAIQYGIDSLTDIELLAIFLRSGGQDDVLTIAANLLKLLKSLKGIMSAPVSSLIEIRGIGNIKALELKAINEISNRMSNEVNLNHPVNDIDIVFLAMQQVKDFKREAFMISIIDLKGYILFTEKLYEGTSREVMVNPKDIISSVIKNNGSGVYCVHNHPSGSVTPSKADKAMTLRIKYFCDLFEINFKGHFIINDSGEYFKDY